MPVGGGAKSEEREGRMKLGMETEKRRERRKRRVVFVAGGVGVNPVMSMVGDIAERQQQREDVEVEVLYGSKMPSAGLAGILFLDRLTSMFKEGKVKGRLRVFLTSYEGAEGGVRTTTTTTTTTETGYEELEEEMKGVEIKKGRISVDELIEAVKIGHDDEKLVYICGPPRMTDEFVGLLVQGNVVDQNRIMTEKWW